MKRNFSIIIFAYNEAGTIPKVIRDTWDFLENFANNFEIIVVDDGSTDGSKEELKQLCSEINFKFIDHPKNLGIGAALKSGYSHATMDWICAIPGDGQFDLQELRCFNEYQTNTCYAFYRQDHDYKVYRRFLSVFNRLVNRLFLGFSLRDVNWIKVYAKADLERITINLESSLIESEICGKLSKCNVAFKEHPSAYLPREYGVSKGGSLATVSKALFELFRLIVEVRRFKP